MDVEKKLKLVGMNNQRSSLNKQLIQFVRVWREIFDEDEDIIDFSANIEMIEKINRFYEIHNYDQKTIFFVEKVNSADLSDCIDQISIEYLNEMGYPQTKSRENVLNWMNQINQFLDECYRLDCTEIIEILNISVAIHFYIETNNEKDYMQFCQKWGMKYPLAPLKQRQIVEDNKYVFDRLNK